MGSFAISTSIDDAITNLAMSNKVVSLSESDPDLINLGAMPATILLPPVEAIMEFVDGNVDVATAIYDAYLMQPEVESYLCALYTSIRFTPNNILIYIGQDEAEVGLVNHLILHFTTYFVMPFNGAYAFMDMGLYRSYLYDLVNFEQLVLNLQEHKYYPVNANVIPKIANDMQFFRTPEEVSKEFLNYVGACQRSGRLVERMCSFR